MKANTKLMARVRDKTFQVTESWSKEELVKALNQYHSRGFVSCPDCGRLDINPYTHFSKCDPVAETYRRESEDNQWK